MSVSIKAAEAYVELGTEDKNLDSGFAKARTKIAAFGREIEQAGKRLAVASGAMAAGLGAAAKRYADLGDSLDEMRQRTGFGVEMLSRLKYAADLSGTSIKGVEKSVRAMQRGINDAAGGTGAYADALNQVGLSYSDLAGMKPEDQFMKILSALANVDDETTKAALATELFGRNGTQLLPIIADGADGLYKMMNAADKAGVVFDEAGAKKASALADAMDNLRASIDGAIIKMGPALVDAIMPAVESMAKMVIATGDFIKQHPGLVKGVTMATSALSAMATSMIAVGVALAAVKTGVLAATAKFAVFLVIPAAIAAIAYELGLLPDSFNKVMATTTVFGRTLAQWFDYIKLRAQSSGLEMAVSFYKALDAITVYIKRAASYWSAEIDVWEMSFAKTLIVARDFWLGIWDSIKAGFGEAMDWIAKKWHGAMNALGVESDAAYQKAIDRINQDQDKPDRRAQTDKDLADIDKRIEKRRKNARSAMNDAKGYWGDTVKQLGYEARKVNKSLSAYFRPPTIPTSQSGGAPPLAQALMPRITATGKTTGMFGGANLYEQMGDIGRGSDIAKQQLETQRRMADSLEGIERNTDGGLAAQWS